MTLRTFRFDRGSVILVGGDLDPESPEAAGLAAVLGILGVSFAFVPPGVELTILSGPGYPVEIAPISVVR